jgi:hypothetical protein
MTAAKYRTKAHRDQRKRWASVVARGDGWCVEPVCLMRTRWIEPGSAWDVPHEADGVTYRDGPAHARCNRSEGATRGNRMRGSLRVVRRIL